MNKAFKLFPFIFLPKNTGLRQPIHSLQLAKLISKSIFDDLSGNENNPTFSILNVGGDEELSYGSMMEKYYLKKELNKNLKIFIFYLPNKLFLFLISPLILLSPKIYELLLRTTVDMAGFEKINKLLKAPYCAFPFNKNDF